MLIKKRDKYSGFSSIQITQQTKKRDENIWIIENKALHLQRF